MQAARRLAQLGCCEIAPGLTDAEFDRIERTHGFEFADDHQATTRRTGNVRPWTQELLDALRPEIRIPK